MPRHEHKTRLKNIGNLNVLKVNKRFESLVNTIPIETTNCKIIKLFEQIQKLENFGRFTSLQS